MWLWRRAAEARAGGFGLDWTGDPYAQPTMTKQIGKHAQGVWWRNVLYVTQDGAGPQVIRPHLYASKQTFGL